MLRKSSARTLKRCPWVNQNPKMIKYHDTEWGVPLHDDRKLFEFLILEGAQAGLSWETVLNKREAYQKAFARFNPQKVAKFGKNDIQRLLKDAGIIRNRAKIISAINNAKCFLKVQKEFGSFNTYLWQFMNGRPVQHAIKTLRDYPSRDAISDAITKDMKQRGFSFVGTTIMYAHMQTTGMVNDHAAGCFRHKEITNLH
ncbi:MAG: DNA-3-methyladenine glycosylase I [Candidatus Sungbacteria bacterium]|nr:DNA-3-methyladenine glycosylase I [Candidatus Sungbacteria bacterium]